MTFPGNFAVFVGKVHASVIINVTVHIPVRNNTLISFPDICNQHYHTVLINIIYFAQMNLSWYIRFTHIAKCTPHICHLVHLMNIQQALFTHKFPFPSVGTESAEQDVRQHEEEACHA